MTTTNQGATATKDERVALYERLPATSEDQWWAQLARRSVDRRVLYIGCGTGRLALPLARVCDELVGVDVDPGMLEAFAARVAAEPELEQRVSLVESAAEDLALDDRFGLVILPSNLLNGIIDPVARHAVVAAAARHCHPDGRVVLQVLNPYWMAGADFASRGRLQPADGGAPVEVEIRQVGFDAWEQRQQAIITYRFEDGAELTDEVDAVALFPREVRALVYKAGLALLDQWGARPGVDPVGIEGGTWHLMCAPSREL